MARLYSLAILARKSTQMKVFLILPFIQEVDFMLFTKLPCFFTSLMTVVFLAIVSTHASAAAVLPTLGGDQETPLTGAGMKHIAVNFDGSAIHLHLEASSPPLLRELLAPHTFAPAEAWGVLIDKAHNFQYGWVPDGIWNPPTGLSVWIEPTAISSGMEVYEGGRFMNEMMIRQMTFDPIFGTAGSDEKWQWGLVMTHNAYAVMNPTESSYEASYRVFLGDTLTGTEPLNGGDPLYGSDTVTLTFAATPVPEPQTLLLVALAAGSVMAASRR